MKNGQLDRYNFEAIKKRYDLLSKGAVRLTQGDLFLTKAIDPTKSVYTFDVLTNENATLQADEIRLNQNDEFIISEIGIFIYATFTDAGSVVAPQLLSYAPVELDKAALKSKKLYAGVLTIGVNNIIYTEGWNIRKHEKITRTQFASMPTPSAGPPVISNSYPTTMPNNDFSEDGFVPLAPLLTLSGAKKNQVTITLPVAMDVFSTSFKAQNQDVITVASTRVAIWFKGLKAQNAATFQ